MVFHQCVENFLHVFPPLLADGMAGQVSPEALFSRLQAEGSKTEAESEVRAQNIHTGYFRPHFLMKPGNFCHILAVCLCRNSISNP